MAEVNINVCKRLSSPILARRCPKTYEKQKRPIIIDIEGRVDKVIEKLELQPNEKILNYGCATGSVCLESLKPFAEKNNWTIYSVDNSATMIEYAKVHYGHPSVQYEFGDVTDDDFPLAKLRFDRIFCIHYLMFLSDDLMDEIKGMYNLLAPGGTMFVTMACTTVFHNIFKELAKHEEWGEISKEHVKVLDSVVDWIHNHETWKKKFEALGMKVLEMSPAKQSYTFPKLEDLAEFWYAHNPFARSVNEGQAQELKDVYRKHLENTETQKHPLGTASRDKEYIIDYDRIDILLTK